MAYLSELWITDPNRGKLYNIVNDEVSATVASTGSSPKAICVDINMIDIWIVNTTANTISQFRNGVRVKDISVGKTPMGIAQDQDGNLWVTNYGSNTVSKITDGKRVLPDIPTGTGPRGVCATPDGTIWVANYISSTVSKIVNGYKVKDIPVGSNPYGICADKYNCIWTANSGSNTVSKIKDTKKVLDLNVGKIPQGICSDKYGNIWVTNYLSDTVTKITDSAVEGDPIPVGDGPFAISTTSDGSVYVCNYLSTTISKIVTDTVVETITVCNNPCGFGDFTGNQAYLLFNAATSTSGKILYSDLDPTLQALISSGAVTTLPDSKVTHIHPTYTTVKDALDYLLYMQPEITSFSNNINTVEIGSTVSNVLLSWAVNKTMASLNINNGVGAIAIVSDTSKQLSGLSLTSNTSWTLTATDDEGTSVTKTTGITFLNKRYWGVSASASLTTSAQIIALGSEFGSNYNMSKTLDATGGKYLYFAVPSSFGLTVNNFKVGGLSNSDWVKTTISFTNASGYTTNYDIFRSGNIQTGSAILVAIS